MTRKILKYLAITIGMTILSGLIFLGFLTYPGILFPYSIEHRNFVVRSGEQLDGNRVRQIIEEVDRALQTSETHDPGLTHQILLGQGSSIFGLLQNLAWRLTSQRSGLQQPLSFNRAVPPHISQIITFRIPDFDRGTLDHPDSGRAVDMVQMFAHEATHTLIASRVGDDRLSSIQTWKNEGYADYVAASSRILDNPEYDLGESVAGILDGDLSSMVDAIGRLRPMRYDCVSLSSMLDESGNPRPTCYYLSRVLVEFLLDVEGMSFDELMDPSVSDTETFEKLMRAHRAGRL